MRILSVDDKDVNRYLVEALLKGHGYEVRSAANGAEALEWLHAEHFDLIISDILMPVMDGFELCRKVKADERFCRIPFIVYTATYTGPQDEAFAMKIGADRFVQKPCEPDLLIEIIGEVLAAAKEDAAAPAPVPAQEEEVLKLYNERLVRKLEQKMLQLEKEVEAHRKTEEVLKQSENKYRSLYNSIRDAILVADINRTIIDCNQAFVDLFGYSLAEMVRKKTRMLYALEEEYNQLGATLINHIDDPGFLHLVHFKKKDGLVFPGEVNIFPLRNDAGEMTGFIGLIRDVTERIRAEEIRKDLESQLHQAQKMESVGRLAGGVAHDYNNMLSVILGYAQIALNKAEPGSSLRDNLHQIIDAAQRSATISRQLLGFARKQAVAPQILDLNDAIEATLKLLRRLIGENIDLIWRPEPDLWPVHIDPSQVDQIVTNLCVNARDAISGVGKVTIETEKTIFDAAYCARLAGAVPGEYVVLTVSDNGCGIDKAILDKIFEPFFTTKELGIGTGLGLATVYGIVKQNNGFIDIESEPGMGATFKIYLPRHTRLIDKVQPESPQVLQRGQGETILIVEDDQAILTFTSTLLADLGYMVRAANGPAEAVRLAHEQPHGIHLLLTDVVMPEMNGRDLAALLQTFYPGLKCLFMSGYADTLMTDQEVVDKGLHFIQKPFTAGALATSVRQALLQ